MRKQIIIIFLIFPTYLYAAEVDSTKALLVAQNFAYESFAYFRNQPYESINPTIHYVMYDDDSRPVLYFINVEPSGSMIISGDDRAYPVLSHSDDGKWEDGFWDLIAPGEMYFINEYAKQIAFIRENDKSLLKDITQLWNRYEDRLNLDLTRKLQVELYPMGNILWDYKKYYNALYPETGVDGHPPSGDYLDNLCPVGCGQVALSQILRYWMWPNKGYGSNSYVDPANSPPDCSDYDPSYGIRTANFGNTSYLWDNMPYYINTYNDDVATAIYHSAVASNADFSYCNTWSDISDRYDAFTDYFRFSTNAVLRSKTFLISWNTWEGYLVTDIDNGRPIHYRGNDGSVGHAFICYAYMDMESYYKFKFNWGFGNHSASWFTLRAIPNENDIGYTSNQKMINNLYPDGSSVAPCSNVISINGTGFSHSKSFMGGGIGAWNTTTNNACGYQTTGVEKVFSFVPPVTGVYSIQVTEADGWVDYMWKSGSCFSMGWNCLASVASPGTYGSMNMTAGTTYYILLDDDNSIPGLHTFYINAPTITCKPCPEFDYTISPISSWQTHSSTHGPNGCKMYRVSVTSGQSYVFKTGCGDGATANYDTYLELYNSSCNLVASDDDGCESLRSIIEWTANYSGYAYLRVRGYGNSSGNYTLAYNRCVIPSSPDTISGPTTVCSGNCHTYTISPVGGATSYQWEYTGVGTPSGSGTSIILCPSSSGILRVRAVNSCGSSSWRERSITVNHAPSMPGFITGPETVTEGNCENYSISAVSGATSYEWQFTGGGTPSGSDTDVTLCPTSSGTLRARAINNCGNSSWREKAITVVGTPTIIVSPTSLSFNAVVGSCDTKQYQLTGSDLTGSVSINTPAAFQVSTSPTSGFANSISIAQSGGNVNTTIYVRFCPTNNHPYSGSVTNASTGATTQNVEVTGSIIDDDDPVIIVPGITLDFGSVVVGECSVLNYQLTANDLSGSITITAPTGFAVSTNATTGFSNSIIVPHSGGNVNTTIYVRFCPFEEIQYSDGIEHSSPGATNVILEVSGTGADSGIATISAIQVAQRLDGSGLIDIYFTLDAPDVLYDISLQISFDGGSSYTSIDNEHLSGDFASIGSGSDKHIVWNGLEGFEGTYSLEAMLDITASVSDDDGPLSTVTDIDGNVYQTVIIGNQEWMAENLRTTRDANGNDITRYCYDNDPDWCDLYGGLYTWHTVMNGQSSSSSNPSGVQGICPAGWHVPSDAEWTELVNYVVSQGYPNIWNDPNGAGNALKSCRQVDSPLDGCNISEHPRWNSHSTHYGFDEFGFSALPGGNRWSNESFNDLGTDGYWWSSAEELSSYVWLRHMSHSSGRVHGGSNIKSHGYSLRCVRSATQPTIYNLDLDVQPTSAGTVSGAGEYEAGAEVNITAFANTGWEFVEWTGDIDHLDDANSAEAIVIMPAGNVTLTANFQLEEEDPEFACGDDITFTYYEQQVTYGTIARNGLCWLDRNLGADPMPFVPADDATGNTDTRLYGDLFQWGRLDDGHQVVNWTSSTTGDLTPTTSTISYEDVPGHGNYIIVTDSPWDWREGQNDDLWQGADGINNPCPSGWRLPTDAELNEERQSWSSDNSEGAYSSALKWSVGGFRGDPNGILFNVGISGYVWSSSVSGSNSNHLFFEYNHAGIYSGPRFSGQSIRCVRDVSKQQSKYNLKLDAYPETSVNPKGNVHQAPMASGLRNTGQSAQFTFDMRLWELITEASPTEGGTVSEGGSYLEWKPLSVEAIPLLGWAFVEWTGDVAYINDPDSETTTLTMPSDDISLVAVFAINTYILTYNASENGTLVGETQQIVEHGSDGAPVEAIPNVGYHFVEWSDGVTDNPRTDINVTENISVTAQFEINTYTLEYDTDGNGHIQGEALQTVVHGSDGSPVEAIPEAGYYFVDWSDGVTNNPRTDENVTEDMSVTAHFALNIYTIEATAGDNGTITPEGDVEVTHGDDQPFTITPAYGYEVLELVIDGNAVDPVEEYVFENVTQNHTIHAEFTLTNHIITATSTEGGSIDPEGSVEVPHGTNQTFHFEADLGYHLDDVIIDDASVGNESSFTFNNVTTSHTIHAIFSINVYTLEYFAGENGSLEGETEQHVEHGGDGTPIEAIPNEGYHFVQWSDEVTDNPRTDTDVTDDIDVTANFAINTYIIDASAGDGGSIDPDGEIVVDHGNNQLFTITPDEGYEILDVLVDGNSVGAVDQYEFVNVIDNHTISAEFEIEDETGIRDIVDKVSVYPNPFDNTVTISNAAGLSRLVIKNIYGQTVFEKILDGSDELIMNAESFTPGVYIFTLTGSDNSVRVLKMIKE